MMMAAMSGALITLSLSPLNWWPAGILSIALYLSLLNNCSLQQAPWRGLLFGLGMFGSGVSWVYVSIHVHGYASAPLAALLTVIFCAGLALLQALCAWSYVRWVRPLPGGALLGLPALWVLFEWLRSWLLTGFPWLYLGYAHVETPLAGWGPIIGVYGLSWICALTGCCLFLAWRDRGTLHCLSYVVIITALWAGGWQLKQIPWVTPVKGGVLSVAIYQPNIPQEQKWDPAWYQSILRQYQNDTRPLFGNDIIVWPEAAIPNYYQRVDDFLDPIAERAAMSGTTLISGVPYQNTENGAFYNGIVALGNGEGVYLKQRLVPFGEYVPMENLLRGLIAFFDLPMSSFSPGPANQPLLNIGGYRIAPFICYEVVYPDLVAGKASTADLLVTISNDSWFGNSIGPLQHLQMARMRALENGRYMIRGTNNGVSAIINSRGQITARTRQFVATSLIGEVQIMQGMTPHAGFGSMPVIAGCGMTLLLLALRPFFLRRRVS
jgi:apolipoprotein N-acyltransferase